MNENRIKGQRDPSDATPPATDLRTLGWNDRLEASFAAIADATLQPGRVGRSDGDRCTVWCADRVVEVVIPGRIRGGSVDERPAVGDWVAIEQPDEGVAGRVVAVLPRSSRLSRRAVGRAEREQVIAANVDVALIVNGLDRDFNLRRIERYLLLVRQGGVRPVIVLNKTDICPELDTRRRAVEAVAGDTEVLPTCGLDAAGLDAVRGCIGDGRTAVLLGSSGVGKSTIVNALLGESRQSVRAVREDDGRGRHTTTSRELMLLPGGGLVIDTPGLREVRLWIDELTLERTFVEIDTLARACRFRDCLHEDEPACAVRAAVASGDLDPARLESFFKLRLEVRQHEARTTERGRREQRQEARRTGRLYKRIQKRKRRRDGLP